ncbi:MAG: hypothetical protein M1828_005282 [Chrysothrix sp. TS-e1954]|nr:MAG: hypothetical protein M1828_005282 [Chrysothrix sp. TS-e1954]
MAPTAIVTGAAQGIGKAIAIRLAEDGYDVCVNDIAASQSKLDDVVKEIKNLKRNAIAYAADVAKKAEVDAMVKASVEQLGPLNTMVANAGIAQVKPLLDLTEDDMQRMFSINVFGVHNCYAAAARQFISQGPPKIAPPSSDPVPQDPAHMDGSSASSTGRPARKGAESSKVYKIIGAASIVAFKPFPLLSHYSAAKWAVRGLTQAYAMEMADHHITVNAYAPGIVGTAMWDLIDENIAKLKGAPRGSIMKKYVEELTALGRTSNPEDVSKVVGGYLASSDSDFVTGQTVVVDGGIVFT